MRDAVGSELDRLEDRGGLPGHGLVAGVLALIAHGDTNLPERTAKPLVLVSQMLGPRLELDQPLGQAVDVGMGRSGGGRIGGNRSGRGGLRARPLRLLTRRA